MERLSELSQTGKGILQFDVNHQKFELTRYQPAIELAPFIKHFWIVRWDLRDQGPYNQTILSHPNVNMVLEDGQAHIFGVSRTTSTHLLRNKGIVLGVKFTPGGFHPFWNQPLDQLLNNFITADQIFGENIQILAASLHQANQLLEKSDINDVHWVIQLEELIKSKLPKRDASGEKVTLIVDIIKNNPHITRVNRLANEISTNPRTLQRLFHRYIGLGPKWVIQRYRLHEAAEQMDLGVHLDWVNLSQNLGYFDQAHFIKDFKAIVGKSPVDYVSTVHSRDQ
ncbi:transcriptional activator FtrA [compost metagenome]